MLNKLFYITAVVAIVVLFSSLWQLGEIATQGNSTVAKSVTQVETTTNLTQQDKPVQKLQYDFSSTHMIYIYGVIDSGSAPQIARDILILGKDPQPITILINSPGGSVLEGGSIISAIQAAKGPVNTLCIQLCASMAAMIHQYGTNRLMLDRSIVMFHPASGGVEGEVDKMYSRLSTIKSYIEEMEENAAKRSKMTYSEYKFKSGVEMWLSAKDAVKAGYADHIVYVRGTTASRLFIVQPPFLGNIKPLPFTVHGDTVTSNDGNYYWVSVPALNFFKTRGL